MNIEFYCPRWGSDNVPWSLFCEKVKAAGYDGIEYAIASNTTTAEIDHVWETAGKNNLKIIAQHYDTYKSDFSKHLDLYCKWLERIRSYPCVKINSQTGKDFFCFEQNRTLIYEAIRFTLDTKIKVVHETHRNKFLFAAHITKDYLEKLPDLRITLDASHWVCVAESFLDDQQTAMRLAIERTEHIHARVGYPEGPQVPDPRIPKWQEALEKHLNWWERVVERKKNENSDLTITTEFGPHPYMVNDPRTGKPISDQWEINVWMMNLLKERYA